MCRLAKEMTCILLGESMKMVIDKACSPLLHRSTSLLSKTNRHLGIMVLTPTLISKRCMIPTIRESY